jgi:hypothetical protein
VLLLEEVLTDGIYSANLGQGLATFKGREPISVIFLENEFLERRILFFLHLMPGRDFTLDCLY